MQYNSAERVIEPAEPDHNPAIISFLLPDKRFYQNFLPENPSLHDLYDQGINRGGGILQKLE